MTGSRYGAKETIEGSSLCPLDAFLRDEGGFTTVAVALALLLSLTLVFASASASWIAGRSAELQRVADATALAGENVVAKYSTVVQVLDACVLSMGLAGIVVAGAGLVACCVPGATEAGVKMCKTGADILDARRDFARSAGQGIEKLESTLPLLVVANSASCASANSGESAVYLGCAIPFPTESKSDFSALSAEVDDSGLPDTAQTLADATERAAAAKARANEALERGWRADCGMSPRNMRERAATLAGLSDAANPYYSSPQSWSFGAALSRSRCYYEARLAAAWVGGSTGEEITDSACRRAFYEYAVNAVWRGFYVENAAGEVDCDLPSLPRNADQTRETSLYTDVVWPCTQEDEGWTLHSSLSCPGASGAFSGYASLAQLEAGGCAWCSSCGMDIGEMGRVAAASTAIDNGYEYYWREVVEASEDYEAARNEQVKAEKEAKEAAGNGKDLVSTALEALSVARPSICPPGAWGCVAVVARGESEAVPSELTAAFVSSGELPAGAAVSAAVLAPDESTGQNNVLASFFDGFASGQSAAMGAVDGVLELWGSLLVGYGSAYSKVADTGSDFLDKVDGVLGGSVGSWLKQKLGEVMASAGLEPADMRLRKPVLVNSQEVLDQAGYSKASTVVSFVQSLPDSGSAYDYARSAGLWLVDELGSTSFTVAELTIPGTGISIPLTIDLKSLGVIT